MSPSGSDDRPRKGLRPIADAVGDALRHLGLEERFAERSALTHWEEVVGKDIASHVQALDIRDGVLILAADHGAWRQEVNMLAGTILAALNEQCPDHPVRELGWSNRPQTHRRRR